MVVYPLIETQQENQVCHWAIAPADISPARQGEIEEMACHLLEKLQYVGVLGIELFLTATGQIFVNEVAPRTHNSGHYTLDACETSQFEMQLRAVTGLPLGSPRLRCQGAVMVNLLGYEYCQSDYGEKLASLAAIPGAHLHWYGKVAARPGRKLGHVTVLFPAASAATSQQVLLQMAKRIESLWYS
jgi:5-(carboxyamino)imidazole ribonucleotide synthase